MTMLRSLNPTDLPGRTLLARSPNGYIRALLQRVMRATRASVPDDKPARRLRDCGDHSATNHERGSNATTEAVPTSAEALRAFKFWL